MPSRPSLTVRIGLWIVRCVLFLKAAVVGFFRVLLPVGKAVGSFFLKLLVPGYRVFFFAKRNMSVVYRPVKNRFMFVVSNRFAFYGVVFCIALLGGITNIHVNAVRAEAASIGQQSILYALATNDHAEFVEEYSDPKNARAFVVSSEVTDAGVLTNDFLTPPSSSLALEALPGLFRVDGPFALSGSVVSDGVSSRVASQRTAIETYSVQSGDTLSGIAQQFGVSVNTILWANNLTVHTVLKPGQELTILPVSGALHTVASGDTLLAIAKKYNVDAATIAAYNNIDTNTSLRIGQQFIIPGGVISAAASRTASTTVAVKDIFTSAPSTSQGSTKPADGFSMIWPTDLPTVVRGLSWFHTGYDIDCNGHADGTSTNDNYAAADGTVIYAGKKNGYGNVVEIDHGNGLITRYGHFHALYVQAGQTVSAGDPLGRCGSTGNSTGTHLHFEVIDAATRKFLNPANYIHY